MRINCLSFLDPEIYQGGGEMVSSRLLTAGADRGHDIAMATVRPRRRELHDRPDLTLLIDIFNHGHSARSLGAWRCFGKSFLDHAITRAPFVHLTNGYADVCNLAYMPCEGLAASKCPVKPLPRALDRFVLRDFTTDCFAIRPLVQRLYTESALNVFVSPLHRRVTHQVLNLDRSRPSFILRPLMDVSLFRNHGRSRDIEYLFVGAICEGRGLSEMRARFRNSGIHLIGRLGPGVKLDFGRHIGYVPHTEIPSWMNRAKHLVFLPRLPEPQGRVVVEAALCGCNIISKENVGALTFEFDIADPRNYAGVEDEFWDAVETVK